MAEHPAAISISTKIQIASNCPTWTRTFSIPRTLPHNSSSALHTNPVLSTSQTSTRSDFATMSDVTSAEVNESIWTVIRIGVGVRA